MTEGCYFGENVIVCRATRYPMKPALRALINKCKHCGLPRDENYCWNCGPTTEDMMTDQSDKAAWALFERMQSEIAREIRNMLGEPPYDQSLFDDAQRQRRIESLKLIAADPRNESERHEAWREKHVAEGWTQGAEFKPEIKQHTNLVPFDQLPATTQSKVRIFDIVAKYAATFEHLLGTADDGAMKR